MEAYKNTTEPNSLFPMQTPLAMAYVPMQQWETLYDNATGFDRGTLFPSLDFPFLGREEAAHVRKG